MTGARVEMSVGNHGCSNITGKSTGHADCPGDNRAYCSVARARVSLVLYSLVLSYWFAWHEVIFPAVVVIIHPPQLLDSQPGSHTHFILAYPRADEYIPARVLRARLRVAAKHFPRSRPHPALCPQPDQGSSRGIACSACVPCVAEEIFFLEPLDFILRVHRHSLRDGLLRFSPRSPPALLSSPLLSVLGSSGGSSPTWVAGVLAWTCVFA
jgi:hypothetical protein